MIGAVWVRFASPMPARAASKTRTALGERRLGVRQLALAQLLVGRRLPAPV